MKFVSLSKTVNPSDFSSFDRKSLSVVMSSIDLCTYSFSDRDFSPASRARLEIFHSGFSEFNSDNMRGLEHMQKPSLIPGRQYNLVKASMIIR